MSLKLEIKRLTLEPEIALQFPLVNRKSIGWPSNFCGIKNDYISRTRNGPLVSFIEIVLSLEQEMTLHFWLSERRDYL